MSQDQRTTTFSLEFFPPKDVAGEERLWQALGQLQPLKPDFVSVTYGAGGSTRERTIRVTSEITARTSIPTVAHLTCVGSTRSELIEILKQYKSAGIKRVRSLQAEAKAGINLLSVESRACIEAASELYCGIVDEVEKIDYQIFSKRAKTSNWRRLKVALPAYIKARKSR